MYTYAYTCIHIHVLREPALILLSAPRGPLEVMAVVFVRHSNYYHYHYHYHY